MVTIVKSIKWIFAGFTEHSQSDVVWSAGWQQEQLSSGWVNVSVRQDSPFKLVKGLRAMISCRRMAINKGVFFVLDIFSPEVFSSY